MQLYMHACVSLYSTLHYTLFYAYPHEALDLLLGLATNTAQSSAAS